MRLIQFIYETLHLFKFYRFICFLFFNLKGDKIDYTAMVFPFESSFNPQELMNRQ